MSFERAKKYLTQCGMADKIMEFDVSSATVELAAQALHCEGARIAKTLSFMGKEGPILILAAGDVKVDNAKYKAKFGLKAKMLHAEDVERLIGHAIGGVCPFGVEPGVAVYLDVSMKRFETMFPACGSDNSAVKLTIPELEQCSGYTEWVDVCKGWQDETR